jgi:hypothetical protein
MRSLLRSWVFVLALALAFNGAVIRQCTAAHQPTGQSPMAQGYDHQHTSHAADAGDHRHHHADHDDNAAQQGSALVDDHACAKCCGICTLVSPLPPQLEMPADIYADASFVRLTDHGSGTDIRVDPGIPKHVA